MTLAETGRVPRFILHDRDAKFSRSFDEVFCSERVRIIRTPIRAPNANAYAERWIRTLRDECLDRLLFASLRQLERVLQTYVDNYNSHRPHRALELRPPEPPLTPLEYRAAANIDRRDRLGGLLHESELAA